MRNIFLLILITPLLAFAQGSFPTEFPANAAPLDAAVLESKLKGKVFQLNYANGAELRLEFKDSYAYINFGKTADIGRWRVEGKRVCIDWKKLTPGCFEVQGSDAALYAKRDANGEIVLLREK